MPSFLLRITDSPVVADEGAVSTPTSLVRKEFMPRASRADLSSFASKVAQHLSGDWSSDYLSHPTYPDGTQFFRSPNALATVKHQYATTDTQAPAWTARGGPSNAPTWSAEFSHRTPTRLVASFTASLISTEPVLRTVKDVPANTRRHVYEAPSATASQSTRSSSPVAPAQCRVAPTTDRAAPAVRRGR